MLEIVALEDEMPVQKPTTLGGGAAVMAADNTWPVALLGMVVIVMVMLSARKGVRAFRFALSYTNLWFSFQKRTITGHFRVRVHSFSSSSGGSNLFVTTTRRGEFFSGERAKEDGDDEGDEQHQANAPALANSNAGCIIGTEMVFIYGKTSSVFATDCKTGSSITVLRSGFFVDGANSNSIGQRDSAFLSNSGFRNVKEFQEQDSGVKGAGRVVFLGAGKEFFVKKKGAEPEWTSSSRLEPLQIVRCEVLPLGVLMRRNARAVTRENDYPWDAVMKLRLKAHHRTSYSRIPCKGHESSYSYRSAVVRGATHTATLRKNVVKIWENRRRRAVMSVPLMNVEYLYSSISALDVDWARETAFLGSSKGLLSVWDLERVTCISSINCHSGDSIGVLRSLTNPSTKSVNNGLILTAGVPSSKDRLGHHHVCLWDSRMLNEAAAVMNSPACDEFQLNGFELVATDCFESTAVHDIRMLNSSSPVSCTFVAEESKRSTTSSGALRNTGCSRVQLQRLSLDEQWWDVGEDSDLVQVQGGDNSCDDDDWEKVVGGAETMADYYSTSFISPGLFSRCFSAISSTLAG